MFGINEYSAVLSGREDLLLGDQPLAWLANFLCRFATSSGVLDDLLLCSCSN
jgi:hypothetical protein